MKLKQIKKYVNLYRWDAIKEKHVYLAGSAKFKDYFTMAEMVLQLYFDKIVSACSFYSIGHKYEFSPDEWEALQGIALQKIKEADAILVIDAEHGGQVYIGDHTREEVASMGTIPIHYLSKLQV